MDLCKLARKHGLEQVGALGQYWLAHPQALRALVNEVLEEAARACRAERLEDPCKGEQEAYEDAITNCINAIRSLKLK